jgi:hypothetical protein
LPTDARSALQVSKGGSALSTGAAHRCGIGFVLLAFVCGLGQSCGGSSSLPVSPPSGPTPGPVGPFANVAGRWSGTLESANAPSQTIALNAVQGGNCVDGTWASDSMDWTGAISGFADAVSYNGQISIELVVGGQRCTGVGDISGPVGADSIRWTGAGFRLIGQCAAPLPQSIVVTLHRL